MNGIVDVRTNVDLKLFVANYGIVSYRLIKKRNFAHLLQKPAAVTPTSVKIFEFLGVSTGSSGKEHSSPIKSAKYNGNFKTKSREDQKYPWTVSTGKNGTNIAIIRMRKNNHKILGKNHPKILSKRLIWIILRTIIKWNWRTYLKNTQAYKVEHWVKSERLDT